MASQAEFKKFVPEPKAQDSLAPQRTVFVSGELARCVRALFVLTPTAKVWTRK